MGSKVLSDIVNMHTDKVDIDDVLITEYVSTDSMLPNFEGITAASKKPNKGKVTTFQRGDILFSNIRTYFKKLWLADRSGACSNDVIVFRPKEGFSSNYIYHLLMSQDFIDYTVQTSKGTKMPRGDKQAILNYSSDVLNETDRNKIGELLIAYKNKIQLNQQINTTLESMAQALFKSWFVDFDPVIDNALANGKSIPEALQAKAEKRKALGEDKKTLPADIQALFPDEFVFDEQLGWIPLGWESIKLKELLDVKYGKDHKKLKEGKTPVYGSGGLMRHVDKSLYKGESILIPRKGTLNNLMFVNEEFWTVDTMFFTIPKINNSAKYLFYSLKRLDFTAMNVGSAVPSMTTKVLNDLNMLKPSDQVLIEFDRLLNDFFNKISTTQKENKTLAQLRDTLLPRLLSGKLTLPEAEQHLKTAGLES